MDVLVVPGKQDLRRAGSVDVRDGGPVPRAAHRIRHGQEGPAPPVEGDHLLHVPAHDEIEDPVPVHVHEDAAGIEERGGVVDPHSRPGVAEAHDARVVRDDEDAVPPAVVHVGHLGRVLHRLGRGGEGHLRPPLQPALVVQAVDVAVGAAEDDLELTVPVGVRDRGPGRAAARGHGLPDVRGAEAQRAVRRDRGPVRAVDDREGLALPRAQADVEVDVGARKPAGRVRLPVDLGGHLHAARVHAEVPRRVGDGVGQEGDRHAHGLEGPVHAGRLADRHGHDDPRVPAGPLRPGGGHGTHPHVAAALGRVQAQGRVDDGGPGRQAAQVEGEEGPRHVPRRGIGAHEQGGVVAEVPGRVEAVQGRVRPVRGVGLEDEEVGARLRVDRERGRGPQGAERQREQGRKEECPGRDGEAVRQRIPEGMAGGDAE